MFTVLKWSGALLVFLSCAGFGFRIAAAHKREVRFLRKFLLALDLMECELQYRLTPLPELCQRAGKRSCTSVRWVLESLSDALTRQSAPDVECCIQTILDSTDKLSRREKRMFRSLGSSLGRFDLSGQLKGLQSVRGECLRELEHLEKNQPERLRSYQTLGMCAGAALVIILF